MNLNQFRLLKYAQIFVLTAVLMIAFELIHEFRFSPSIIVKGLIFGFIFGFISLVSGSPPNMKLLTTEQWDYIKKELESLGYKPLKTPEGSYHCYSRYRVIGWDEAKAEFINNKIQFHYSNKLKPLVESVTGDDG